MWICGERKKWRYARHSSRTFETLRWETGDTWLSLRQSTLVLDGNWCLASCRCSIYKLWDRVGEIQLKWHSRPSMMTSSSGTLFLTVVNWRRRQQPKNNLQGATHNLPNALLWCIYGCLQLENGSALVPADTLNSHFVSLWSINKDSLMICCKCFKLASHHLGPFLGSVGSGSKYFMFNFSELCLLFFWVELVKKICFEDQGGSQMNKVWNACHHDGELDLFKSFWSSSSWQWRLQEC